MNQNGYHRDKVFLKRHYNQFGLMGNAKVQKDQNLRRGEPHKQLSKSSRPLAFYFDPKERKKIVHSIIDGYLQSGANPETQSSYFDEAHDNGSFGIQIRQCKTSQGSRRKVQSMTERKLPKQTQNMSKTAQVRFFPSNHRSFDDEEKGKSLPIIQEISEAQAYLQRPQSQDKRRKVNFEKTPPSRPFSHRHTKPLRQELISDTIFDNNQSITSITIGESPPNRSLLTNRSRISRVSSGRSSRSFFKCRYYEYNRESELQKIVKKFNKSGEFLYKRQLKIEKLGGKVLWQKSILQNNLLYPIHKTLDKELYRTVLRFHGDEPLKRIYVNQEQYNQLFKNENQWLRDIMIGLCKELQNMRGKIINNKITINNVCRMGEKKIFVVDWSASAIREKIVNLDNEKVVKCSDPALKEEPGEEEQVQILKWICRPEYLAPEIVGYLCEGKINEEQMWGDDGENSYASDIWSLGLLLFEILTLIPLDAKERHSIKGRLSLRRGFLSMQRLEYAQLSRKQKALSQQISRIIKKQCSDLAINKNILEALSGMVKFNREQRLTPSQIIKILSC